jgi:hypothetical protein
MSPFGFLTAPDALTRAIPADSLMAVIRSTPPVSSTKPTADAAPRHSTPFVVKRRIGGLSPWSSSGDARSAVASFSGVREVADPKCRSACTVTTLRGGSGSVRQSVRILGDLAVQPVQLFEPLQMCQQPADLGRASQPQQRGDPRSAARVGTQCGVAMGVYVLQRSPGDLLRSRVEGQLPPRAR